MTDSKSYKVVVIFEDGVLAACGAVEYEGAVWIVPEWLPFPSEGYTKPERMIRLDQFQFLKFEPPAKGPGLFEGADYALSTSLPKTLFAGALTPQLKSRFVVLDRPDVRFRVRGVRQ